MARRRSEGLTEAEVALVRSSKTPDVIKRFTSRSHDEIVTRTSAFRKIAEAARAEREAIQEVVLCEMARDGVFDPKEYQTAIKVRDAQIKALETQNALLRDKSRSQLAAGSMATYGDD